MLTRLICPAPRLPGHPAVSVNDEPQSLNEPKDDFDVTDLSPPFAWRRRRHRRELAAAPRLVFAQAAPAPAAAPAPPAGPFKLPPLGYPFNALEPHIDARTMEIHSTRHHQAFVTNLNNFAKDTPQIAEKPIVEVLGNLNAVPDAIRTGVRNNIGGTPTTPCSGRS